MVVLRSFRQLFVSIIAVFAVVMVNVTISYGLVRSGFKHLEATLISMKNASDARVYAFFFFFFYLPFVAASFLPQLFKLSL